MKSQNVRLIDVLIIGPLMIYAGMQLQNKMLAASLIAIGGATMAYNWQNYQRGGYTPHLHTAECPTGFIAQGNCLQ